MNEFTRFPHCDARILHAPGECEFCDLYPDRQSLRMAWGIAFTGHEPVEKASYWKELPCPADFNRRPDTERDHRRWAGNVASTQEPVNESVASRLVYSNVLDFDYLEVVEEQAVPATASTTPSHARWLTFRRKRK